MADLHPSHSSFEETADAQRLLVIPLKAISGIWRWSSLMSFSLRCAGLLVQRLAAEVVCCETLRRRHMAAEANHDILEGPGEKEKKPERKKTQRKNQKEKLKNNI